MLGLNVHIGWGCFPDGPHFLHVRQGFHRITLQHADLGRMYVRVRVSRH